MAEPDFELVAGRLGQEEIVRVLGPKSVWLAAKATIVQVRITAGSAYVRVTRDGLHLDAAESLKPLGSEEVLAAVSLPASAESYSKNSAAPARRADTGADPHLEGPNAALYALAKLGFLGMAVAAGAIVEKGGERYWNSARGDVEAKTSLPRDIAAGETSNFLLVFLSVSGKPAGGGWLRITASVTRDGTTTARSSTAILE